MTKDEIEDLYNLLCNRLTQAGEENTNMVLARLTMLLLQLEHIGQVQCGVWPTQVRQSVAALL